MLIRLTNEFGPNFSEMDWLWAEEIGKTWSSGTRGKGGWGCQVHGVGLLLQVTGQAAWFQTKDILLTAQLE